MRFTIESDRLKVSPYARRDIPKVSGKAHRSINDRRFGRVGKTGDFYHAIIAGIISDIFYVACKLRATIIRHRLG